MANPLLDRAPPQDFAGRRQALEIRAKIEDFEQLVGIIEADLSDQFGRLAAREWRQVPVDIRLRFGWADVQKSLPALTGRVQTTVSAVCQRCLEAFEMPLAVDLDLLLVQEQGGVTGVEGQEVWELSGDTIRPLDIIEEALIMAMPFSAMHESAQQCEALPLRTESEEGGTLRPFANLKAQMDDESS